VLEKHQQVPEPPWFFTGVAALLFTIVKVGCCAKEFIAANESAITKYIFFSWSVS